MKSMSHPYRLIDFRRRHFSAVFLQCIALLLASLPRIFAQQGNEKTFASPGDAVLACITPRNPDQQALNAILGSSAATVLHTGDEVADKKMAADFVRRYDQMHRVVMEPDRPPPSISAPRTGRCRFPSSRTAAAPGTSIPKPARRKSSTAGSAGNENDAIDILHSLVDAQHDYASQRHDGDKTKHYAMKFISDDGKQNGLYWKTNDNEHPSPSDRCSSPAAGEGYAMKQGKPAPFHGYFYRMLTKQGAAAKGGARDYIVNGEWPGFAFVAYPAEYRNSGVMTFIVNQDGVVYEKDLGGYGRLRLP